MPVSKMESEAWIGARDAPRLAKPCKYLVCALTCAVHLVQCRNCSRARDAARAVNEHFSSRLQRFVQKSNRLSKVYRDVEAGVVQRRQLQVGYFREDVG